MVKFPLGSALETESCFQSRAPHWILRVATASKPTVLLSVLIRARGTTALRADRLYIHAPPSPFTFTNSASAVESCWHEEKDPLFVPRPGAATFSRHGHGLPEPLSKPFLSVVTQPATGPAQLSITFLPSHIGAELNHLPDGDIQTAL